MIQIKSDIVSYDKIGKSSVLLTSQFPQIYKNNYHYTYVKNIKFFPLRNSNIDQIKIQIVDGNENQIKLERGQPTIVQFLLRKKREKMDHLISHIQLDSEMNQHIKPMQNNNNFEIHLNKPIYMNKDAKIAMTGISFPNNIRNIPNFAVEKEIKVAFDGEEHSFKIRAGNFSTIKSFIKNIRNNLSDPIQSRLIFLASKNNHLKIQKTDLGKKFKVDIKFPNELKQILGVESNQNSISINKDSLKYIAPHPIDLNAIYPGVMICYANFISHSIIGNDFFPILKMIPLKRSEEKDNYVSINFENYEFLKCNTTRLDAMHFHLKRLDGEFIEFDTNKKIIINLALKT